MRFGLLGSLEVVDDDGAPVDIGGLQSRTVLAALLAAEGRLVTTDVLVDAVWGDRPPASAVGSLQTYVSRLRRRFGNRSGALVFEPPGYRLAVEADEVDFRRFEALADRGRNLLAAGRPAEARPALLEALGLWRGPALVELADAPLAQGLARRLEERRLAAVEDRVAADLALGRHAAVIGELGELVGDHPLQEGLRASLALALYRAGRQSEALRALDDARRTLGEELGVDPGRPLRELEAAILAQDPTLDLPAGPAAAPAGPTDPATSAPRAPNGGRSDAAGPGPPPVPLVGRDAELLELLDGLTEAGGATRIAIIEGEPGIGKSRLAEEVAAEATRRDATVLWGRAFEGGAAPALWPWLPPLRALAATQPDGDLAAEVASLLSPTGRVSPDGIMMSAEPARFALFEAVGALLAAGAHDRPLVLVLDDLQWADPASLELLSAVTGRLGDASILVLVTVRELEVGRNDAVVDTLAALTRRPGTRRIHLRGLSREATAELVRRTTASNPGDPTITAIHERAEGNPFYATELARLLGSGDGLADVPAGVRDVVRRRLAHLPATTVELLQVAAVVGRDVELGLLVRASGLDFDRCLDDLEPAVVQRLLTAVRDQPGTYRFAHALVRESVVDDVSTLKQSRLHLKVADALDDTDDTAEILAEHLWEAVPIGVSTRAAAALERAALVAIRRLAYDSARHLLERAVQLRRAAGSSPADAEAELVSLAHLVSLVGAMEGYTMVGTSPLLARGKQLAEQTGRTAELLNLLWAEWAGLDVSNRPELADPIAAELLARSEHADIPIAPVLGHTAFGIGCWHRGEITRASTHIDRARAGAQVVRQSLVTPLFDLDQLRLSTPFSVYLHDLIGDLDDPEARYEEIVQLLPGDRFWELLVRNFAASGAITVGDVERSIRACRLGMAVDPEGVSVFWSSAQRAYLGAALCLHGDIDEGVATLDEAWSRYSRSGLRTNAATWFASKAHGLAAAGRVEAAAEALAQAQDEVGRSDRYAQSTVLLAQAVVLHAQDENPAQALRQAFETASTHGAHAAAARVAREATKLGVEPTALSH